MNIITIYCPVKAGFHACCLATDYNSSFSRDHILVQSGCTTVSGVD